MGKYEPLAAFLNRTTDDVWTASFAEVEAVLGFQLPPSARNYREWWANQQKNGGHSQTRGWQDVGWQVQRVDLANEKVEFRRRPGRGRAGPRQDFARSDNLDDLLRQAGEMTGIADRDLLIREALRGLIAREAGLRLARMGGSMPDIKVPPRERPSL